MHKQREKLKMNEMKKKSRGGKRKTRGITAMLVGRTAPIVGPAVATRSTLSILIIVRDRRNPSILSLSSSLYTSLSQIFSPERAQLCASVWDVHRPEHTLNKPTPSKLSCIFGTTHEIKNIITEHHFKSQFITTNKKEKAPAAKRSAENKSNEQLICRIMQCLN